MLPDILRTFKHEVVSAILVSLFIGGITLPFRKLITAYRETKSKLEDISTELTEQRTNCLNTLQKQGDEQIKLLGKSVDVLQNIQLDNREMLTHLRDKS
jgi:hypothetical protein